MRAQELAKAPHGSPGVGERQPPRGHGPRGRDLLPKGGARAGELYVLAVNDELHIEELQDLTELAEKLDIVAYVELKPESAWPIRADVSHYLNSVEAVGVAMLLLKSIAALKPELHEHALDLIRRLEVLAEEV